MNKFKYFDLVYVPERPTVYEGSYFGIGHDEAWGIITTVSEQAYGNPTTYSIDWFLKKDGTRPSIHNAWWGENEGLIKVGELQLSPTPSIKFIA